MNEVNCIIVMFHYHTVYNMQQSVQLLCGTVKIKVLVGLVWLTINSFNMTCTAEQPVIKPINLLVGKLNDHWYVFSIHIFSTASVGEHCNASLLLIPCSTATSPSHVQILHQ